MTLMMERFDCVDLQVVAYKGGRPLLTDLLGGRTQMTFINLPSIYQHIKAGKLKAIAITSAKRTRAAPDIPSIAESGLPGYELYEWNALFAPAGTPADVQKVLADAIAEAMKDPATAKAMTQGRMEISPLPLAQFAAYVKEQTAWWTSEIKAAGIEPE